MSKSLSASGVVVTSAVGTCTLEVVASPEVLSGFSACGTWDSTSPVAVVTEVLPALTRSSMLALTSGLLSVEEQPLSITHATSAALYILYFIIYIKSFWTEYHCMGCQARQKTAHWKIFRSH